MPELNHVPHDCAVENIIELLHRDGGLIINDCVSKETVMAARREIEPYLEAGSNGTDEFVGYQTKRVGALMSRSAASRELALHPFVNAACKAFLQPYCDTYHLHLTQAVSIGTGEGQQPLHRDHSVWSNHVPRSIETQFSTIWALTSGMTRTNRVPTRSHPPK